MFHYLFNVYYSFNRIYSDFTKGIMVCIIIDE